MRLLIYSSLRTISTVIPTKFSEMDGVVLVLSSFEKKTLFNFVS